MSTFKVEIVSINSVTNHPGADRLDLVTVNDWQCVASKDAFKQGDLAIYFPIDSLLPGEVESKIFGKDSKVKLHNSRVKTIKLRGAISQGLIVKPELFDIKNPKEGKDLTKLLNISKYEPIVRASGATNGQAASKRNSNPNFKKYGGIENAKNYTNVFKDGEIVSVTEKIHGGNFRAGYVPFVADTLWKKFKKLVKLAPAFEFVYGSNNVQLQNKLLYKGYYSTNIYSEMVVKYDLKNILKPNEVVYGEVYGDGVQKNYSYGCTNGERKLVFFDLRFDGKWVDTVASRKFFNERSLPIVPELYRGPYSKEKILSLRDGRSVFSSSQSVREGVVVKPLVEEMSFIGRKILKFISDDYLLKNQDAESTHD